MKNIPRDAKKLIEELDRQESGAVVERIEDLVTETDRLELARKMGRRELVNELKALLNRKDEE